jgi:hypothetical protein
MVTNRALQEEKTKLVSKLCDVEHELHVEHDNREKMLSEHEEHLLNVTRRYEKKVHLRLSSA